MAYDPAHQAFCSFVLETGSITESSDGTTPATLPALPANPALCGYMASPDRKRGLNNSYGFSIGQATGAYKKRGVLNPSLSIVLRGVGAIALLQHASRTDDELPYLCFYVGVRGQWTEVYRFCKIGGISFRFNEATQGEAAEIEVTLDVQALAVVDLASPLNPDMTTLLSALNAPLFWHDVRTATIGGADFRPILMGASVEVNHNLERKSERPNWGDNQPLSRTNYHLLEHTITAGGEISLHSQLDTDYLNAAADSMNWGDIVFGISDFPATQELTVTLTDCIPTDYSGPSTEASAQMSSSIPFAAKDAVITAELVTEE